MFEKTTVAQLARNPLYARARAGDRPGAAVELPQVRRRPQRQAGRELRERRRRARDHALIEKLLSRNPPSRSTAASHAAAQPAQARTRAFAPADSRIDAPSRAPRKACHERTRDAPAARHAVAARRARAADPEGRHQGPALPGRAAHRPGVAAHGGRVHDVGRPAARRQGHAHVALRRGAGAASTRRSTWPACARWSGDARRGWTRPPATSTSRFPYFIRKAAPVSGVESLLDYQARGSRIATDADGRTHVTVTLTAPVTSLCPCSKKISRLRRAQPALAHHRGGRRRRRRARARGAGAGRRGRGVVRGLRAAEAPRREVGDRARLRQPEVRRGPGARHRAADDQRDPRVGRFTVASENFESIHNHSAYAEIEGIGAARSTDRSVRRARTRTAASTRPDEDHPCASQSSVPASPAWAAAWLLHRQGHAVTLFEAGRDLGGHTATVDVTLDGVTFPVDTGFLVFNDRTYPRLIALFDELGVASVASEMSFSCASTSAGLEWAGTNLASLFAQPRNALRPAFWRMLRRHPALQPRDDRAARARRRCWSMSLGEYLDAEALRRAVPRLVPAADGGGDLVVADARHPRLPAADVRALLPQPRPAADLRPAAVAHRRRRRAHLRRRDRRGAARRARRHAGRSGSPPRGPRRRSTHGGGGERFDEVVLACHSDQALRAARRPDRRRRRGCSAPSATSPTASCCTPTRRCCRARAARGRRGTTSPPTTPTARGRSPVATSSTSCSRCRAARR